MSDFVCILAGGLGTRLRALYSDRPKALVPLLGRPCMNWQVEGLVRQGYTRIHIAAGYRAPQLRDWAEQQPVPGATITVSVEPEPLGTGGGLGFVRDQLPSTGTLFVMNGDSLLPRARLASLASRLTSSPDLQCVLAAVEMTELGQYGTVDLDDADRIRAFREKATNDRGWVNGGIYCLRRSVIDTIPSGVPYSIEKDIFPALATAGALGAVRTSGPLLDIGTPEGLERTAAFLSSNASTN